MKRLILILLLLSPCLVMAGTCPSASSYGVNGNATLASLGVTRCFFIAANGNDTPNTGADEAHPLAHAPGMPNCLNNCASIVPAAGDGYIFKGGDTWHFGNSGATPYTGGTWVWTQSGTNVAPIYFGVDSTWFTGGSWSRPILTGDNATSTSTSLTSCSYQIGTNNNIFDLLGINYTIIDNFEATGLCQNDTGAPNGHDIYFRYAANTTLLNLYLHGWTHVQFDPYTIGNCISNIGHCYNIQLFAGGGSPVAGDTVGSTYKYIVVDGSDSDPSGAQLCFCDFYDVSFSVFTSTAQAIVRFPHTFHDNLMDGIHSHNIHPNMWESVSDFDGVNANYNNVYRNIGNDANDNQPMEGIWPIPCSSTSGVPNAYCTSLSTMYIFNNVFYNVGQGSVGVQMLVIGQNGANQGNLVIFNNTLENSRSDVIANCDSVSTHLWDDANNLYVTDAASQYSTPCTGATSTTNLLKNHTQATSSGYTNLQTYAFSPTAGGSFTVGVGTKKSAYCTALTSAGMTAAGTACLSDTSYGPVYTTANHAASGTARTPNLRGATTWDVGAYEFNAGAASPTVSTFTRSADTCVGGSSTLAWTTANADSVTVAGIGTFGPNTNTTVTPSQTTTYSITATGTGGTSGASTVTVGVGCFLKGKVALGTKH